MENTIVLLWMQMDAILNFLFHLWKLKVKMIH